jgi:hypothetical protein
MNESIELCEYQIEQMRNINKRLTDVIIYQENQISL